MKVIAIIPARGGSKRIARKNIKNFLGKPIISYTIQAAIESTLFDEVMVSTDDDEIASVALLFGANVPFRRSPKTSDDFATTADVILEVIEEYRKRGSEFDYACCIYPTAPFITPAILKDGMELIRQVHISSVFPVVAFGHPIWRAFKVEHEKPEMYWPENRSTRTQDLPKAYHDAGQFYWIKPQQFVEEPILFGRNSRVIEVDESKVHDIDTLVDWRIAELKFQLRGA